MKSSKLEIDLDHPNVEEYLAEPHLDGSLGPDKKLLLRDLIDISPALNEAASAIVDDSFTRCFKSNPPEPWNWNLYLFPLWCLGVLVRYLILFPVRVMLLAAGWGIFLSLFIPVHFILKNQDKVRRQLDVFVASWTGVVKYHGPRPSVRPRQVFVANHTSMIDFIILEQMTAFAVIMQKHPGWVGLLQSTILESLGCSWFNRTEAKDRIIVTEKIKQHIEGPDNNPLLMFPEGTCVNNQYTVMFKRQSFTMHLVRLMTSWAVVCDVWYLEPQTLQPGETPIEFAERVRDIIATRAGIKKVPWDGYLKYYRPSPKLTETKQQSFAEAMLRRLEER